MSNAFKECGTRVSTCVMFLGVKNVFAIHAFCFLDELLSVAAALFFFFFSLLLLFIHSRDEQLVRCLSLSFFFCSHSENVEECGMKAGRTSTDRIS